jgi:hypothetical protein
MAEFILEGHDLGRDDHRLRKLWGNDDHTPSTRQDVESRRDATTPRDGRGSATMEESPR